MLPVALRVLLVEPAWGPLGWGLACWGWGSRWNWQCRKLPQVALQLVNHSITGPPGQSLQMRCSSAKAEAVQTQSLKATRRDAHRHRQIDTITNRLTDPYTHVSTGSQTQTSTGPHMQTHRQTQTETGCGVRQMATARQLTCSLMVTLLKAGPSGSRRGCLSDSPRGGLWVLSHTPAPHKYASFDMVAWPEVSVVLASHALLHADPVLRKGSVAQVM